MMTDPLGWLVATTVWSSVAIVAVLLLRRIVRARFGAGRAYALWLAIPLAICVQALPAPERSAGGQEAPVHVMAPAATTVASISETSRNAGWLPVVWIAGSLAMFGLLMVRQRRFRKGLGRLVPLGDGTWRTNSHRHGPLVLGWIRPKIVLPADFEGRYSCQQQRLVLCHERVHCQRWDGLWNVMVVGMRCIFWFNPLVHLAESRFLLDQEMACDEAVMQTLPGTRQAYAEALLANHIPRPRVPSGVRAFGQHPLKERITMLNSHFSPRRRIVGNTICGLVLVALAAGIWAASPDDPGHFAGPGFSVDFKVTAGDIELEQSGWIVEEAMIEFADLPIFEHLPEGAEQEEYSGLRLSYPEATRGWSGEVEIAPIDEDLFVVTATFVHEGEVIATPQMMLREGQDGSMKTGSMEGEGPVLYMEVTPRWAD